MNTVRLFIFGLISGILSVWLMALFAPVSRGSQWSLFFVPGIVFGLTISIYFKFFRNSGELTVNKICFWILSSAIAYNSAVGLVLFYVMVTKSLSDSMTLPLFLAGMVGGGLMLVGYHYFLFPLEVRELLVLTVFAGILGVLFRESTSMFINLYVVWQSGMALALGALWTGVG